ncbi:L,D-transpeptidase family protein [Hyphomicrobium sp.]|uniref:L,D-transpeptidase family protein n=1 Tax=Hyphomicrobium sp. TaxID=82 RepID=UPI0025C525C8|nr:L,D-transpeptidase family protein [Hyphomicrobium sp.]MCC7251290.1 L,D-transpeptidase family protein [Hyphomicrobium sp.]
MIKMLKRLVSVVFLIGSFASTAHADDELAPLAEAVSLSASRALAWPPTPQQTAVQAFYEERGYAPLWVHEAGFKPEARTLIEELAAADTWGLPAEGYQVTPPQDMGNESLADAEVRLSFAILDYVEAARGGRIAEPSQQLSSYLDRRPDLPDPLTVLRDFAGSANPAAMLTSYHPQHEQFRRLRAAYLSALAEARHVGDAIMPVDGPDLHKGMDHPEIAILKRRLGVASTTAAFDDELDAAVRRFQREHAALRADGIVGRRTRRALNATDISNLAVLRANMEQWRWMPRDLGASHILVNIPAFTAELIKDGVVAFSERVIVGKTETQTPIFSEGMQTVVLHPRWYVPEAIKLKEILPSLLSGRSLERRGFVLSRNGKAISSRRVNWSKADIRAYDVYQPSGESNALGRVKFLFPNKHAVYLHDTPSRSLFDAPVRTFSHGCVRVRNPLKLAQLLLEEDKSWSEADIKDLTRNGPFDNEIILNAHLPVHITYFTAWVEDDGTLRTMRDIYGHQKRISLALDGRWSEIDKGKDHLAPVNIAEIRLAAPKRQAAKKTATAEAASAWGAPMGLFGSSSSGSRSHGASANDIFRRAFGN